jgi:hypothetical protein
MDALTWSHPLGAMGKQTASHLPALDEIFITARKN